MNKKVEREILAAHADRLNSGLKGPDAYPSMNSNQSQVLMPLFKLAEWLSETLVMVEPSPIFVQRLGQDLAMAATQSQLSLFERYRKAILLMAATIGSALSVVGLVLFIFFDSETPPRAHPRLRYKSRVFSRPSSDESACAFLWEFVRQIAQKEFD